jgi:hypothetical protein
MLTSPDENPAFPLFSMPESSGRNMGSQEIAASGPSGWHACAGTFQPTEFALSERNGPGVGDTEAAFAGLSEEWLGQSI